VRAELEVAGEWTSEGGLKEGDRKTGQKHFE